MSKLLHLILALTIVFLSAEILLRRWLWVQIPAQVPGVVVYGVLLLNILFLANYGKSLRSKRL